MSSQLKLLKFRLSLRAESRSRVRLLWSIADRRGLNARENFIETGDIAITDGKDWDSYSSVPFRVAKLKEDGPNCSKDYPYSRATGGYKNSTPTREPSNEIEWVFQALTRSNILI